MIIKSKLVNRKSQYNSLITFLDKMLIKSSNWVATEWINIGLSATWTAFVEVLGYQEYLTGADTEDKEHFEDVHPGLLACCVLCHYTENTRED